MYVRETIDRTYLLQAGRQRLADLMAIETVLTLNEAFCQHHQTHCVVEQAADESSGLVAQCEQVEAASAELRAELWRVNSIASPDPGALCKDYDGAADCKTWVARGDCNSNPGASCSEVNPRVLAVRVCRLALDCSACPRRYQ